MRRVHGIIAAVVEEVTDVVGAEYLDQSFVLGAILLDAFELVAGGAESAARHVAQRGNRRGGFAASVDQVLCQSADDAVSSGVHIRNSVAVLASRLDNAAGGGIDDGGDAAGLGIKGIHGRHVALLLSFRKRVSIAEYATGFSAFRGRD